MCGTLPGQIRSPKVEGRRPKQIRTALGVGFRSSDFGTRPSFGLRSSDFDARWPKVEDTSFVWWLLRPYLRGLTRRWGAGPSDAVFRWSFALGPDDHRLPSANPPGWLAAVSIDRFPSPRKRPAIPLLAELGGSSDPCGYKQGVRNGTFPIAIATFPA